MIFYRTVDNELHNAGVVENIGFPLNDASYIPDEYLAKENFVILRTCFGLGDWGIISAFPKKLKEKYPDCYVWIPSPKLLKGMFGHLQSNWSSWDDPFQVGHTIFDNNPYVDGFIDEFTGGVNGGIMDVITGVDFLPLPLAEPEDTDVLDLGADMVTVD